MVGFLSNTEVTLVILFIEIIIVCRKRDLKRIKKTRTENKNSYQLDATWINAGHNVEEFAKTKI